MRIAFVGKGGSGKTTISALFAKYVQRHQKPVLVFDADINIHLPKLLSFKKNIDRNLFLSNPKNFIQIKKELIHNRKDIKKIEEFRKTTPPSRQSLILNSKNINNSILKKYCLKNKNISLFVVGTYEEEVIGKSCYHNNLAVFENILSHLDDKELYVIADMVAGVDSFANTLHSQFDLICLIVEPTIRSVEVYKHYIKLATRAGVGKNIIIIGNKIKSKADLDFIKKKINSEKIIGFIKQSRFLELIEKTEKNINIKNLEKHNLKTLEKIDEIILKKKIDPNERLKKLWKLHKKYISQNYIKNRFKNLEIQIDKNFKF